GQFVASICSEKIMFSRSLGSIFKNKTNVQDFVLRRSHITTVLHYSLLIILLALSFVVLIIMVNMSLRPTVLIYANFWGLAIPPIFDNYQNAFERLVDPMSRPLLVTLVSILGITLISCPAAYTLARIDIPGRKMIFFGILALMMVPGAVQLAPNFILANQLNLRGTLHGLIIFYIAEGQPFAIFLISSFFAHQSGELFEAARIDGASELQALRFIAVPLAWPIIMTVAVLNFLGIYSDLIWPSLMLTNQQQTLMIALQSFATPVDEFVTRPNWGVQAAGYTIG